LNLGLAAHRCQQQQDERVVSKGCIERDALVKLKAKEGKRRLFVVEQHNRSVRV